MMPERVVEKAGFSGICTGFRNNHFVHTEGVTGSIPVTPTIHLIEIITQ